MGVVARCGTQVLFSVPRNPLPMACEKEYVCKISHRLPFVDCVSYVIYRIQFQCVKVYIKLTGRCLNATLRKHHKSFENQPSRTSCVT